MVQHKNNGHRLIFIGGSPRSGTTLVQNMLDCHPLILGGPEFIHLQHIIDLRRRLHSSINKGWIDIICTREDIDSYFIELIEKLFLPLADKNQCEFYSEKSPENILVFSNLIDLFPKAHFIHVIRDPRAIVSSMQQVNKRAINKGIKSPHFTENLGASIAYVKKCLDAGFTAASCFSDKVLTVIYEQLVTAPEEETKKICKFLEIEWNDLMLYPGGKTHLGQHAITTRSDEIWYDAKAYNRNPESHNIEKWRSELTLCQKVRTTIAFRGNQDLEPYGYSFSRDSLAEENFLKIMGYYLYFRIGLGVYNYFSKVVKKIPGISYVRKSCLAIVKFIG